MYHHQGRSNNHKTELGNLELQTKAPSLFASQAMEGVSDRYTFLPTITVIESMREAGWAVVDVQEQRVRLEGRKGFQKHVVRFQRRDIVARVDDFAPEIALINSHDAKSAYQIHAALYRFVCANGLMVSDSTFGHMSVRHSGHEVGEVLGASFGMLNRLPELTARVGEFRARRLTREESLEFARRAIELRYNAAEVAPISAQKLLTPFRSEDRAEDLWTVFNRVQENLTQGGLKDYARRNADGHWFPRTRAITGLDENTRINKGLWELAETLRTGTFPAAN